MISVLVKFQRMHSLTIFVEENEGGEETHISNLKLIGTKSFFFFQTYLLVIKMTIGQAHSSTNMNDLKKAGHEH